MNLSAVLFVSLSLLFIAPKSHAASSGQVLFKLCASCHDDNGGGKVKLKAPAIAGMPAWYVTSQLTKFQNGQRGKHVKDIAGMRMRPMARMLRTPEDVKAVANYVASLTPSTIAATLSGDVEAGKTHYATCLACHGPKGEGNQAMMAPPINGSNDWYMLTQLKNFKHKVRGSVPGDAGGAVMSPMAAILPDEKAMIDVITYIQTL